MGPAFSRNNPDTCAPKSGSAWQKFAHPYRQYALRAFLEITPFSISSFAFHFPAATAVFLFATLLFLLRLPHPFSSLYTECTFRCYSVAHFLCLPSPSFSVHLLQFLLLQLFLFSPRSFRTLLPVPGPLFFTRSLRYSPFRVRSVTVRVCLCLPATGVNCHGLPIAS